MNRKVLSQINPHFPTPVLEQLIHFSVLHHIWAWTQNVVMQLVTSHVDRHFSLPRCYRNYICGPGTLPIYEIWHGPLAGSLWTSPKCSIPDLISNIKLHSITSWVWLGTEVIRVRLSNLNKTPPFKLSQHTLPRFPLLLQIIADLLLALCHIYQHHRAGSDSWEQLTWQKITVFTELRAKWLSFN